MGWRFRKSFKLFPGARLNLSRRGLSATIGGSPLSLNIGGRGAHLNVSIPGTGLSYRQKLSGNQAPNRPRLPSPSEVRTYPTPNLPAKQVVAKQEIRSASTFEMTSQTLRDLHQILVDIDSEQQQLDREISVAGPDWQSKSSKHQRWENGFLFKHIWKARFAALGEESRTARDKLEELMEQRKLTCLATVIDIAEELKPLIGRLYDSFAVVAGSACIWDTTSTQKANQQRDRTTATSIVERAPVTFGIGQSDLLQCEWKVPCLGNANGGDMFIYPGFLLYRITKQNFAVIDCREVSIVFSPLNFIEEETVPPDAQVTGHTWKYANKNGSPDRRFSNNFQIPIALYGELSLTSQSGLNERYLVSNVRAAQEFASQWNALSNKLREESRNGAEVNQSRRLAFYGYSAVLDEASCPACADADGKSGNTPSDLPAVPNPACTSSLGCRCVHIPVYDVKRE
jgi:hypothetical protein